jgi:2'-5' RNA ligase
MPADHPQLDLLGAADARPAEVHRLFLALLPDAATRARLAQVAETLRAGHPGLHARWVNPARYHATLHFLGDHATLRQDQVDAAMAAAGRLVGVSAFEWGLDHASSFRGRQPPCVLRSIHMPEPLQQLWQDLRHALVLAGQGRHVERSFTPHVTLAYGQGMLPETALIESVAWPVTQVGLIHSVVGQQDYQVLANWSLR